MSFIQFLCLVMVLSFALSSLVRSTVNTYSSEFGYPPKQIGYFFHRDGSILGYQEFPSPRSWTHQQYPYIELDDASFQGQVHLRNSKDYARGRSHIFEHDDCIRQYEWQQSSFPSCNTVHEIDFVSSIPYTTTIVGHGFYRDVWSIHDGFNENQVSRVAFKTLRWGHDMNEHNFDRHRRDAVASERLTKSPFVMDIYAHCGHSVATEFGEYDLSSFVEQESNDDPITLFHFALQVAHGIADLHNTSKEGLASIAHTDITPKQFIYSHGIFKLNDFNRCRFLAQNNKTHEPCPFFVKKSLGKYRSPEEYEPKSPLDEKIDVYSMGNIFYYMLTKKEPFQFVREEEVYKKVRRGDRPRQYPLTVINSTHWATKALLHAMNMCWEHSSTNRPTARMVQHYLQEQLEQAVLLKY